MTRNETVNFLRRIQPSHTYYHLYQAFLSFQVFKFKLSAVISNGFHQTRNILQSDFKKRLANSNITVAITEARISLPLSVHILIVRGRCLYICIVTLEIQIQQIIPISQSQLNISIQNFDVFVQSFISFDRI